MKDCLITTLKAAVNDSSLLKIGERKITLYPLTDSSVVEQITIKAGEKVTFTYKNSQGVVTTRELIGNGNVQYFQLTTNEKQEATICTAYPIIRIRSHNIGFDLSILDYSEELLSLELGTSNDAEMKRITGDISSLGNCINLTSINATNQDVYGKVEELASKMYKNGRTSGSLSVYAGGARVTYNGSLVTGNGVTVTFSSEGFS